MAAYGLVPPLAEEEDDMDLISTGVWFGMSGLLYAFYTMVLFLKVSYTLVQRPVELKTMSISDVFTNNAVLDRVTHVICKLRNI